jgi:hypothetical protein
MQHKPQCLWSFTSKICKENAELKQVTEPSKPIQSPKNIETKVEPLVQTNPSQKIAIDKSTTVPTQPTKSSIVFGKRSTNVSHNVPIQPPKPTLAPSKPALVPLKPTLAPPKVAIAPSRPNLDSLPLVEPLIASNPNWPILTDVVNVPGDGNCLFHALRAGLRSLGLYQGTAVELRGLIVRELRNLLKNGDDLSVIFSSDNYERQSTEENLTFGQYFESLHATDVSKIPLSRQVRSHLDQMASRKWGTEIEIWMTSRFFNVNIDIYTLPRIPHPDNPKISIPIPSGREGARGTGKYLPLSCLNHDENTSRPTIRLFNASGASATGIHYQVLPASISIDQFLEHNQ